MWEFPNIRGHLTEADAAKEAEKLGLSVKSVRPIGSAGHIFTHVEWNMIGYEIIVESPTEELLFETGERIRENYAIPTAFRFILKAMK